MSVDWCHLLPLASAIEDGKANTGLNLHSVALAWVTDLNNQPSLVFVNDRDFLLIRNRCSLFRLPTVAGCASSLFTATLVTIMFFSGVMRNHARDAI